MKTNIIVKTDAIENIHGIIGEVNKEVQEYIFPDCVNLTIEVDRGHINSSGTEEKETSETNDSERSVMNQEKTESDTKIRGINIDLSKEIRELLTRVNRSRKKQGLPKMDYVIVYESGRSKH